MAQLKQYPLKLFLNRLGDFNTAISIYAPCNHQGVVGATQIAKRAKNRIGEKLDYHLVTNNCHKFSYECLTGKTAPRFVSFSKLIDTAEEILEADDWRVWDY